MQALANHSLLIVVAQIRWCLLALTWVCSAEYLTSFVTAHEFLAPKAAQQSSDLPVVDRSQPATQRGPIEATLPRPADDESTDEVTDEVSEDSADNGTEDNGTDANDDSRDDAATEPERPGRKNRGARKPNTAAADEPTADEAESSTDEENPAAIRLGPAKRQRLRIGVEIVAQGSACRRVLATVPLPMEWPEQHVRIVSEEISENVHEIKYRQLSKTVQQMIVEVDGLAADGTARAILLVEIDRHEILPPQDTAQLQIPTGRIPKELRNYLSESPYIEVRHRRIQALAKELRSPDLNAWQQVEKIYDYVREKVEYREGKIKGAVDALRDGYGDCEEMTSLFVALCRANKIPARLVWVTDHCYPEFYLVDSENHGHWIPCQAAGTRAFGSMPDPRPILQKGDNILIPEKKSRERYVSEFLRVDGLKGNPPRVKFIREFAAVE